LTKLTDIEIIEMCKNGNDAAFTELINRYKNLVYSVILRMTNDGEEANDLAQEVFIKVYKNLNSYSAEFKFSTWIMSITSNHIIDFRRKRKLETVSLENMGHEIANIADKDTPEAILLRKEEAKRIHKIIENLPAIYKVPIVMYHIKDMSYQEIANKIGEPLSKVKNRIFRGRKMLKTMYVDDGSPL